MKKTVFFGSTVLLVSLCMMLPVTAAGADRRDERDQRHEKKVDDETKATVAPGPDRVSTIQDQLLPVPLTSAAGEEINWQVLSAGGNTATSTNFNLSGTVGQTAVGIVTSSTNSLNQGYWQDFAIGSCCRNRGDADGNSNVDILDIDYFIAWLYRGGPALGCAEEGDVDDTGGLDILDIDYFIDWLYRGGPAPVPCP